jgi:hypothetical protein
MKPRVKSAQVKKPSVAFSILNGLKQEDALSPLIFSFAIEYDIRNVQEIREGLQLDASHQLLVYAVKI